MSGWSRQQLPSNRTGQVNANIRTSPGPGAGGSNSAAMERLFSEQDYGILGQRATQRAIERNNANHLAALPRFLDAFHLSARDAYDAEVVNRIAEFQQNFGRRENAGGVDGIVGGRTLDLLTAYYDTRSRGEVDTSSLWPDNGATLQEQYEHYARMASLFGNAPREGEPLLIGIRGVLEFSDASHEQQSINAYDDTYVLILQSDDGYGVWTFAGATHAYQAASSLSPNADGRGGGDVGTVRPTHDGQSYMLEQRGDYHGRTSMGLRSDPTEWGASQTPNWWALGHVPMDRDTDHDRRISGAEERASASRTTRGGHNSDRQIYNGVGDYGTVTWMHPGYTESKANGRAFASIGCLTAREEDLDNIDAISRQTGSDIRLIVVEAAEAASRMSAGR